MAKFKQLKKDDFPILCLPDEQLHGVGSFEMILAETKKFLHHIRKDKCFEFEGSHPEYSNPKRNYGVYKGIHEEDGGYFTHVEENIFKLEPADLIRKNRIVAEHGLFQGNITADEAEHNVRDIFIDYAQEMVSNYHYLINLSPNQEINKEVLSYMLRGAMPNYNEKAPLKQNIRHFNFQMQKRTTTSAPKNQDSGSSTLTPYPTLDY